MKDIIKTIKDIVFRPKRFFGKVSHHGIKEPLRFLIVLSLFTQLFIVYNFVKSGLNIPLASLGIDYNYKPDATIQTFLVFYVLSLIWVIFFSFLWPAVSHLFIKMFNRKARYKNTYKSIVYSGTPLYITIPFYIILVGSGFALLISRNPVLIAVFVISAIIEVGAHIYSVYLKIMSMSRLQGINMFQAFICIYFLPTGVLVLLEFIALLISFTLIV